MGGTPYSDIGVHLPYHNAGRGRQWSHGEKLHAEGFLLVEARSPKEFVVQSLGNGRLYVNKLLEGGGKDFVGPRPPELKVSTAPAEGGRVFATGYKGDPQNLPVPDRSDEPGWWRPEDSDASVVTDWTQSSKEDVETDYGGDEDDWMPGEEEGEEEGDIRVSGSMTGNGGDDDDDDDGDNDDTTLTGKRKEEHERRNRDFEVVLPADKDCFTKLHFWQNLGYSSEGNPVYSLYFEHGNGGTLADLRDAFRARRRRVPEHFIWHVCEQLCTALAHLYYHSASPFDNDYEEYAASDSSGEEEENGPSAKEGQTVYHRDLFARNAFPDIRLGGFGRAYIEGDPVERIRPRAWDSDPQDALPEEWEDVAALGTILRELATTHVDLLPAWGDRQTNPHNPNNGNQSDSRANRIRVQDANTGRSPGAVPGDPQAGPYDQDLIRALQMFEWEGMTENPHLRICDERADGSFGHEDLPAVAWVVRELLPRARSRREYLYRFNRFPREEDGELFGYGALDVSWSKPPRLMPFTCSEYLLSPSTSSKAPRGQEGQARLERVRTLLELRDDVHGSAPYEFVRINLPAAQVSRVESHKRKGDPEREKLPEHLEAELHGEFTSPLASSRSSSPGGDDSNGDKQGRLKRTRHSY
ncbi:hypothetical protein PG991_015929 [Apiospora marii]|uniref:Protein kinase domain-containing protein n=1 Tax=Apiospora marii TaxID=335849 RepID=A0ABR1R097_9PEZI